MIVKKWEVIYEILQTDANAENDRQKELWHPFYRRHLTASLKPHGKKNKLISTSNSVTAVNCCGVDRSVNMCD